MADAYFSGPDLDSAEGDAALSGAYGWFGVFGQPPRRATGPRRAYSRHAGKRGHRWAWLVKLVGFENFQRIVALEPQRRLAVIHAIRQQAIESIPRLLGPEGVPGTEALLGEQGPDLSGLGYGALLYSGGGI
jgi:hypothetical protein